MPSPVPKLPEIIENLKKSNFKEKVGYEQLRVEIIRVTGAMLDKTVRNIMRVMKDLGYIKDSGEGGIWFICQKKPYNFPQSSKPDEEKVLDKYD